MNTCEWNPQCMNNATCNNLPEPYEFNCTCVAGYEGTLCETGMLLEIGFLNTAYKLWTFLN